VSRPSRRAIASIDATSAFAPAEGDKPLALAMREKTRGASLGGDGTGTEQLLSSCQWQIAVDLEWSHQAFTCGSQRSPSHPSPRARSFRRNLVRCCEHEPVRIARPNGVSMLANNPRGVTRSSLPWLAVVLALSACDRAGSGGAAPGGTTGLGGDATDVEEVGEAPVATQGDTETSGEPSIAGGTDTGGSLPESIGGAAFDGVGGASDDVGGSAGEANGAPEASDDDETAACAIAHPGGVVNHQLASGGRAREYRLFVPDSYDGETRLPLMFNLHGTGGDAAGQAQDSGMERLAQEEGFIVIGLQGVQNSWNVLLNDPNGVDDVRYASDVLDDVLQKVCVDERKVYATGFSGGARMSSRLACNLSERITAIAPVSGIRWPAPCSGRAVPVVTFHGLADPQNTYAGMARGDEWAESVEDALKGWANHNACDETRGETPEVNRVSVYSYGNCADGADVVLYRIAGLGHTWAKDEVDATRVMWTFLRTHSLP
jgi:polyhydroxybutyrate depolymerase